MKRILMVLTSHRLDCLKLCMDLLIEGGSIRRFDRVALLCSGVEGAHRRYVDRLLAQHRDLPWDVLNGPRGRGKPISDLQNECVRRNPDALYFKIDEDTFVSRDWDLKVVEGYERFRGDPRLSLITPVVTNNQRGAFHLLKRFPELGAEFVRRFNLPIVPERMGPVWLYPKCASFMMRSFLNLDDGNARLRALPDGDFEIFSYPFSINCICYDYRHWNEIGGVPEQDENGWGEWIPKNNKIVVLATRALVHHYSFFVQQDWLDRSSLLEDLREANVGRPVPFPARWSARAVRVARQLPRVVARRLKRRA